MFTQFTHLVSDASGWAYLIIAVFALLDAVVPVVPSEATVITAGVVAASGDLELPLVIIVAALGAFLGDNAGYLLWRKFGDRAIARFFRGDKARRRVEWADAQLRERGGELIVLGRFIPGGRTLVSLTAGSVSLPWRRFALFDAVAAVAWALYAGLLGYIGGRAFEGAPWKGLLLAFGIALSVAGGTEIGRSYRKRRSIRRDSVKT
jgi:membrane-associated protein